MTQPSCPADLLERAIRYGLESMEAVGAGCLSRPTPCVGWDVHALLRHVNDSVRAMREGIELGRVDLVPSESEDEDGNGDPAADLVAAFRGGTRRLLRAWTAAGHRGHRIVIAGHPMVAELVAITGAIEIAMHGWDLSVACGSDRPIPAELAVDLLTLSPLVVNDALRHPLFAAPVAASWSAGPSDRLIAFLGRSPAGVDAGVDAGR
ncbi:TIGR03086 family metal-binding protein [Actinoallomurus purpureus]|uniref:TIGR03086 family metal-binding protein n=1 Tax=Actinoallomurus purpureus TaxID=478114 RepID=UPI002093DB8F|nr:TIGR03086 family metal-binding protein [Actinoallomurus purpureus]MCO6006392.1 TIGR03086 family metal-binding protein [Actinoallomurus purpureus]